MKNLKIKASCFGNNVSITLAAPSAELGDIRSASVQIRQVNNIPDHVGSSEVLNLFKYSTIMGNRLEVDFSELGVGRIIR